MEIQTATTTPQTSNRGFQYRIDGQPDFSFLTIRIPRGQTLKVEAGGMAAMDTTLKLKTRMKGGFSRFLTGESLFINEYSAPNSDGEISIAPGPPGDLKHVYLNNETIYLQNSAYLASSTGIDLQTKWQGLAKGFFSGESFFLIKCTGTGDLWFNTFGSMIEMVDVSDDLTVDTGHIVAFTDGLQYDVKKLGGYKSLFLSGEGLVCRFRGTGKVWVQTRKVPSFARWLWFFRPVKKRD